MAHLFVLESFMDCYQHHLAFSSFLLASQKEILHFQQAFQEIALVNRLHHYFSLLVLKYHLNSIFFRFLFLAIEYSILHDCYEKVRCTVGRCFHVFCCSARWDFEVDSKVDLTPTTTTTTFICSNFNSAYLTTRVFHYCVQIKWISYF